MKENKVLKWSLILSAVIVANLFFNYSLQLAFDGPDYNDFCEPRIALLEKSSEQNLQEENLYYEKCNEDYRSAKEDFEQKVFISLISIGVIVLIASVIIKNQVLTSALALTAFLDFIIASIRYWQYSDELLKVSILFIALLIIFYLIVKKFKNS